MTLSVTVSDVHRMTPDAKQFRLVADDRRFEFDPGQHTAVHFEADGEEQERPYTAINAPETNQLVLAIKRYDDGTGSVYVHERTPGDEIDPVGGNLHLRDPERDALFVATGTGITPLYPMVRQYASEGQGTATLVFGERDQEHRIFRESLDQLRAGTDAVSVDYVLSDAADEDWTGGRATCKITFGRCSSGSPTSRTSTATSVVSPRWSSTVRNCSRRPAPRRIGSSPRGGRWRPPTRTDPSRVRPSCRSISIEEEEHR